MSQKSPDHSKTSLKLKTEYFHFGQIERYFLETPKDDVLQIVSERTYSDLDLEEVFKFVDRTSSRVGQQYLYQLVRTIPKDEIRVRRLEHLIQKFTSDSNLSQSLLTDLGRLNSNDSYYISSLFLQKHIEKPGWFWVIPTLSLSAICSFFLSLVFPQLFIFLIFLLTVNFGLHYWNKNNLFNYAASIPQLILLVSTAKRILQYEAFRESKGSLFQSVKLLSNHRLSMSLFKLEAKLQSEFGIVLEYLLELVKALFLIEPIILFRTLRTLDSRRIEVQEVFDFVGEIDAALSIKSLRDESPVYCIPTFTEHHWQVKAEGIFHPLIYNAIPNNISLQDKSMLLTGSNMSGKSTFIRTIGVNLLLGQTINTSFAQSILMPRVKIHSAIRIADNLMDEKSYYFEEVLTVKDLLIESETGSANLFLLDELFKGTNTIERIAAGESILRYLSKSPNLVFVSTHDLELVKYIRDQFDVYHFSEVIDKEIISFDYKLKKDVLVTTNAIRILELNEYPSEVITRANQVAYKLRSQDRF